MLENPNVISMSKQAESDKFLTGISDRTVMELVLKAGEFTAPVALIKWIKGKFGVETHAFNDTERRMIQNVYDHHLGVLFFKPHPWSRAYRIEAHLDRLTDERWLMSLLAGISEQTMTRTVVEPWPQFMADFTTKRIAAIAELYGPNNRHRLPITVPTRTAYGRGGSR
jgi:hypothetical protein